MALITLALAWEAGIPLGSTTAIKEKPTSGRGGPGLGDWAAVMQVAATSRDLRELPHRHPIHSIRSLLADQDAADARQRLSERRNDDAHLRRPDPIDLPSAVTEGLADLTLLAERSRALADFPLWHVTETRWDTLAKTADVRYRELTGDHPVVPTRVATSLRHDLEPGSIHLGDSTHELHLLRPFLTGEVCRVCRAWWTFHAVLVPKGGVQLKGLEHGTGFTSLQTRHRRWPWSVLGGPRPRTASEGSSGAVPPGMGGVGRSRRPRCLRLRRLP
ncbi:hypothetical protein AB0C98_09610 [Streptomyces sp. NPDC048558]|uniref:hypothetical protein n=1 Tax=Streptomyces sp. NPDC048558 TaxID=3155759 RepID=UPI0033E5DA75